MDIFGVLSFVGGLAMFLYGMSAMGDGLTKLSGGKLEYLLEKLTSKRIMAVLLGAGVTAVIQSSSATTVMVVGFVNSGIMKLNQAVGIIMGANIGTTITSWILSLTGIQGDNVFIKMLNPSSFSPILAIIGVFMLMLAKGDKKKNVGTLLTGFSILMFGMHTMSSAVSPLADVPEFTGLLVKFSMPVLGVLAGTILPAVIQSSSASVGILQALCATGSVSYAVAIPIIMGQNIGTCITAVLASLSANRNAKRTTIIHLSFNIIGTILFFCFIHIFPFVDWMCNITSNPAAQIANTHTIFNVVTTLILLPFGTKLARLAQIILPIREEEFQKDEVLLPLAFVDENNIGSVPIAISSLRKEALAMLKIAQTNVTQAIHAILKEDISIEDIEKKEKRIDYINYEISNYMTSVSTLPMNTTDSNTINALYKCFADIERIGDHAMNIVQYVKVPEEQLQNIDSVKEELLQLEELLNKSFQLLYTNRLESQDESLEKIERIEQRIDELTVEFRNRQIERMVQKKIHARDCVIYSEIMTDIERVSDHIMNIIEECRRCSFTLNDEELQNMQALQEA